MMKNHQIRVLIYLLYYYSLSKRVINIKKIIFSYISAHLANQNYNICIRRNNGKCSICYITSVTQIADAATIASSFGLSKYVREGLGISWVGNVRVSHESTKLETKSVLSRYLLVTATQRKHTHPYSTYIPVQFKCPTT